MKNIAAQMVNFDREQMRRIANNMPEQYDEKPQVSPFVFIQSLTICTQVVNGLYTVQM